MGVAVLVVLGPALETVEQRGRRAINDIAPRNCEGDIHGQHHVTDLVTQIPIRNRSLQRIEQLRLKLLGAKLGFSISPNTFGPGLYLVHWGSIAISPKASFGAKARVHTCVNVSGAPVIGENVYLGPGAIVVGDITIGNNVTIGANAVVYSSFPDNVTILGNPARVVKKKS